MSETTEVASPDETAAPAPEPTPAPTTARSEAAPEAPAAETAAAEPAPKPKQTQADRRFAHLTAKAAADRKRAEDAEARAAAAEALLQSQREGSESPSPRVPTDDAVLARAQQLREAERFDERRVALVNKGFEEFGKESWLEKTGILGTLGATENPSFMQALVELDNAPKLVAALADDADELDALLKMPPVAMAAKMGRMAAKFDMSAGDAKPKISGAPKPVTPVSGRATPAPDVFDPKLSMAEYVRLRQKTAPRHLGGQGKVA